MKYLFLVLPLLLSACDEPCLKYRETGIVTHIENTEAGLHLKVKRESDEISCTFYFRNHHMHKQLSVLKVGDKVLGGTF
jgi:hypothetical protein